MQITTAEWLSKKICHASFAIPAIEFALEISLSQPDHPKTTRLQQTLLQLKTEEIWNAMSQEFDGAPLPETPLDPKKLIEAIYFKYGQQAWSIQSSTVHDNAAKIAALHNAPLSKIQLDIRWKWLTARHQKPPQSVWRYDVDDEERTRLDRLLYISWTHDVQVVLQELVKYACDPIPRAGLTYRVKYRALQVVESIAQSLQFQADTFLPGSMSVSLTELKQSCRLLVLFEELQYPHALASFLKCDKESLVRGLWREHYQDPAVLVLISELMVAYSIANESLWHRQCPFIDSLKIAEIVHLLHTLSIQLPDIRNLAHYAVQCAFGIPQVTTRTTLLCQLCESKVSYVEPIFDYLANLSPLEVIDADFFVNYILEHPKAQETLIQSRHGQAYCETVARLADTTAMDHALAFLYEYQLPCLSPKRGVGYWKEGANFAKIVNHVGKDGKHKTVPSVVSFPPQGNPFVGFDAVEHEQKLEPDTVTIRSAKRLMGKTLAEVGDEQKYLSYSLCDDGDHVAIDLPSKKTVVAPSEVSAILLKYIKDTTEEKLGHQVVNCVLTVPAHFNESQRQATLKAAAMAGFQGIRLLNEPTAAAMAYGLFIAVSVLSGNTHLGGEDINHVLYDYMLESIQNQNGGTPLTLDRTAIIQLQQAAEHAKVTLSSQKEVSIYLDDIGGVKSHKLKLTRSKFESLCDPLLTSIGIEKADGTMEVLIPKNSRIPIAVTKHFETLDDDQRGITVEVFEGEKPVARDNVFLTYFNFTLPRHKAGKAGEFQHAVTLSMDANGILQVKAGAQHDIDDNEVAISNRWIAALTLYMSFMAAVYVFARVYFATDRHEFMDRFNAAAAAIDEL
ncbi:hypothetical protein DYB32_003056 [Aphanomyces invadans]|uniref:RZZ complex subunit KNTC1/ROD C-terminal domain-containing protein n=1 Tax=Aphanomyces invadans TaxID=157072 RepID=A0A3R6Z1R3_9STRA|nr:hypothetical protein DYB32_003056 [Aphanomyces invadans]